MYVQVGGVASSWASCDAHAIKYRDFQSSRLHGKVSTIGFRVTTAALKHPPAAAATAAVATPSNVDVCTRDSCSWRASLWLAGAHACHCQWLCAVL